MTERPHADRPDADPATPNLRDAMRRLRIDEAERTGVVVALRDAEFARLAILQDRIRPVLDQVPQGIDLFDAGLTPGETPRLWLDMIAFVEMGRDKRTYRFLQDTRNGRRVLAESANGGVVADRITAYVASRLIERERMLALPPVAAPADEPAQAELVRTEPPRSELPRADLPAALVAQPQPPESAETTAPAPHSSEAPAAPAPPLARADRGGIRFSGFGGFVLFLLGLAAGAGGLLAVAQFATRL
jgi:hypothetical protein